MMVQIKNPTITILFIKLNICRVDWYFYALLFSSFKKIFSSFLKFIVGSFRFNSYNSVTNGFVTIDLYDSKSIYTSWLASVYLIIFIKLLPHLFY